jgi:hypothetical protein
VTSTSARARSCSVSLSPKGEVKVNLVKLRLTGNAHQGAAARRRVRSRRRGPDGRTAGAYGLQAPPVRPSPAPRSLRRPGPAHAFHHSTWPLLLRRAEGRPTACLGGGTIA